MKNFFIILGFGVLSFIMSIVYYKMLPFFILWFTLGMQGYDTYLSIIAPAPVVIFVALWLYSTGIYFFNEKLIKASEIIIILSIAIGIAMVLVPYLINTFF